MKVLLAAALLLASVSCRTVFKVTKIDPSLPESSNATGIRYSLAKPILRVVPKSDGTLDVGVELVPDDQHTYAIDVKSYTSSYKVDVKVERGILKKIVFNTDSSGPAKEIAATSGEIAKAIVERENKKDEERQTKEKEELEKQETRRKELEEALRTARDDVAKLQAEIDALESQQNPDQEKIDEKKVALAVAEEAVRLAELHLDEFEAEIAGEPEEQDRRSARENVLQDGREVAPRFPKAWGPMFYAIENQGEGVQLRALDMVLKSTPTGAGDPGKQLDLFTSTAPKAKASPAKTTLEVVGGGPPILPSKKRVYLALAAVAEAEAVVKALEDKGIHGDPLAKAVADVVRAKKELVASYTRSFEVKASRALTNIRAKALKKDGVEADDLLKKIEAKQMTFSSILVQIENALPAGDYELRIAFDRRVRGETKGEEATLRFRIEDVGRP